MDISKIDYNFIEIFSSHYSVICDVFGNPETKSSREQTKIRKWVKKTYLNGVEIPNNVKKFISEDSSNSDFFDFLKSCYIHVENVGTKQKQLFDKNAVDFPENIKNALWQIVQDGFFVSETTILDHDIYINCGETSSCRITLILKNISDIPEETIDYISFDGIGTFIKDEEGYRLVGVTYNHDKEIEQSLVIRFSDAEIKEEIFNATSSIFSTDPWDYLVETVSDIIEKEKHIGNHCFNEKEKELLPLFEELKAFHWMYSDTQTMLCEFSVLKSYIKGFNYNSLLKDFEKFEKILSNCNKRIQMSERIKAKLNQAKYEPLWRKIYNKVLESQAEYSIKSDVCCDKKDLTELRNKIQHLMELNGYSGTYPHFIKHGSIDKIRLAQSYKMSYFVGNEKNVEYHIYCNEEYYSEQFTIRLLCGTAMLRKNTNIYDVFSCFFNADGKRFINEITYETCFNEYALSHNLENIVRIAVKKAELTKLTKEERKIYDNQKIVSIPMILFGALFMGLLFGILMTLGMILVCAIITLFFEGPQETIPMIMEMPWLCVFIFCFVGFGGAMSIVNFLAERK